MNGFPVVVGVEAGEESIAAVQTGLCVATAAEVECFVVHGVRDVMDIPLPSSEAMELSRLKREMLERARTRVLDALRGHVPDEALAHVEVEPGNPAWVLKHAVERHGAGLLVLGAKRHGRLACWLGGSTAHNAVRTIPVPILITGVHRPIHRVLVAVDRSEVSRGTVEMAAHFAAMYSAALRVVCVTLPIPVFDELAEFDRAEIHGFAREDVGAVLASAGVEDAEVVIHEGEPCDGLVAACREWDADLMVIGSHGKGWVDRAVIGSTTERLLNRMPAPLLVVPAPPAN